MPYGSCTLGSINLSKMITGNWIEGQAQLDTVWLIATAKLATRFLDDVITKNNYPIPELTEMANLTRQIGLGVMGFGDLCIKMHIRYGSQESVDLAKKIMSRFIKQPRRPVKSLPRKKELSLLLEMKSPGIFLPPERASHKLRTDRDTKSHSKLLGRH